MTVEKLSVGVRRYLTVNLKPETKAELEQRKIHRREPYDDVIVRLLKQNHDIVSTHKE